MAQALPLILATLAGFALVIVLTALWQSMRVVLQGSALRPGASAPAATAGVQSARTLARNELVREKNTLLQAIRDVRFEHDLGKVSDADLERLDAQYRLRARAVLGELETQLEPYRKKARALLGVGDDGVAVGAVAATAAEPPPTAAAPAAEAAKSAPATCPGCSTSNDPDAVFCKKCGARLTAEVAS